jgi:biopolymer transport protein ExbD
MIFIDAKWYPAPEFAARMLEFGSRTPHKSLLLRVDRDLPFGSVRSVLATLQKAGFKRVSLITFEGPPMALIRQTAT